MEIMRYFPLAGDVVLRMHLDGGIPGHVFVADFVAPYCFSGHTYFYAVLFVLFMGHWSGKT